MSTILAIDDNADNLVAVTALLKLSIPNCRIITAPSGETGIQKAISEPPDTILLDIHMPEMDGFEVCEHLKNQPETAHIPIIILTAVRTDSESRIKALGLGADSFLTKPIDASELAAQVNAMLRIKKAEDNLRNEKELLEELVMQRVRDLSVANKRLVTEMEKREKAQNEKALLEKQLIQAQKMEAVGALAGGIAHDFNNILSPILGYTELLKQEMLIDTAQQDAIDEIYQAALRAKALVKQILTFSRQSDEDVKPIHIQPILKETLSLTQSIIPSTITIEEKIDPSCKLVVADPTQIHQMIMNMVTNAFHAMQDTGGTLTVQLLNIDLADCIFKGRKMSPGNYVCLKIKDTGTGIKPDILDHIFDPYFTTKGIHKGTGLGLSVVHGIVKNCLGEIFVKSTLSKGTCFEIYLPAVTEKTHHTVTPVTELPGGNEHILLVDDEKQVSGIETQILRKLGYQVTEINRSTEALKLFSSHPDIFDILITDLTMPDLTGIQLSEKILEIHPDFPIIMTTGFSENLDENSAGQMGIKAFLLKPIILSDLARTVRKLLDAGR